MSKRFALLLLAALTILPDPTLSWFEDKSWKLNNDVEDLLAGYSRNIDMFMNKLGIAKEASKLSPTAVRLFLEGISMGLVSLQIHTFEDKQRSLILAGYGGNGANALALAFLLAKEDHKVTVVLLPHSDGGRGDRGILNGNAITAVDEIEKLVREWNATKGNQNIEFITCLDIGDIAEGTDKDLLEEANNQLSKIAPLLKKVRDFEAKKKIGTPSYDETQANERDQRAIENLSNTLTYYSKDGIPQNDHFCTLLKNLLQQKLNIILQRAKEGEFSRFYEGHSGQGYNTDLGPLIFETCMTMYVELRKHMFSTSIDYFMGMTPTRLRTLCGQYYPDDMLLISLKGVLFTKAVTVDHGKYDTSAFILESVRKHHLSWTDFVEQVLGTGTLALNNITYSRQPKISNPETEITKFGITAKYNTLMKMDVNKAEWNAVARSLEV